MNVEDRRDRRRHVAPALILLTVLLVAALFVAASLRRPAIATADPTPILERAAADSLVGPIVYTIDATSPDVWRHFDFSRGSVVDGGDPLGWDIAFRRFHVIANGGDRFAGNAGVIDMGPAIAFDSVMQAPDSGWALTEARRDTTNVAIDRWYAYSWISHILDSKGHTYAVRTADGRFAKMRFLSYYCTGATPGCVTFEYVYQGSGSRRFVTDSSAASPGSS